MLSGIQKEDQILEKGISKKNLNSIKKSDQILDNKHKVDF